METSSITGEHSPRHPSSQRRHALGGCSWERGWGDGDHWTVTIWGILTHPKHHRWLVYHMLSRRHFFKITVCNVFFFFFGAGGIEIWRLTPQPRGGLLSTILVGGLHRGSWHRRWSNTHYFHRVLQPSDSPCSNSFLHSPCPPFQHLSVAVPFLSWPEFTAEASHCPPISPLTYFRRFFYTHSIFISLWSELTQTILLHQYEAVVQYNEIHPPPTSCSWKQGTLEAFNPKSEIGNQA